MHQLTSLDTQFLACGLCPCSATHFPASTSGAAHPTWNLVISNVPGPRIPLYCAGARLVANYPVSVVTDGMGLNITVTSYLANLDVGIVADRDQPKCTA